MLGIYIELMLRLPVHSVYMFKSCIIFKSMCNQHLTIVETCAEDTRTCGC